MPEYKGPERRKGLEFSFFSGDFQHHEKIMRATKLQFGCDPYWFETGNPQREGFAGTYFIPKEDRSPSKLRSAGDLTPVTRGGGLPKYPSGQLKYTVHDLFADSDFSRSFYPDRRKNSEPDYNLEIERALEAFEEMASAKGPRLLVMRRIIQDVRSAGKLGGIDVQPRIESLKERLFPGALWF